MQSGVKRPTVLKLAMIPTPSSYAVMETGARLCLQPGILTPSLALYAGAAYVVAYARDYGGWLQHPRRVEPHDVLLRNVE